MFQDTSEENSLDDAVFGEDDFPSEDDELGGSTLNTTPENLIRDEDGDEFNNDEDSEDPLFDSFEDRDFM